MYKIKSKPWILPTIVAAALVGIIGLAFILVTHRPPTPESSAAQATADLISNAGRLEQSFSSRQDPGSTNHQYISSMETFERDCGVINQATSSAQTTLEAPDQSNNSSPAATATALTRLQSGAKLCGKLSRIASTSKDIYVAVRPILSMNSRPKIYQMLPPFTSLTRASQLAAVNSAVPQLTSAVKNIDFPTQSLDLLLQLQHTMQTSHGLSYSGVLGGYQDQVLAERHQYWTDYVDIGELKLALTSQLRSYCRDLTSQGNAPSACQHIN